MEKYWDECSAEEKAEVRQIEQDREDLKEQYQAGAISHRKFSYRITKLMHRLDEIERKYEENV